MAAQLAHNRGAIGIAGIGWVSEVESFTVTPVGDPEDLEALEGTVGQLEPKGKRLEIGGTIFIPAARHAYTIIYDYWKNFTRLECYAVVGTKFISAVGRFNAPEFTDDGTRFTFVFRGVAPKDRDI
jgi:hypothetical protein